MNNSVIDQIEEALAAPSIVPEEVEEVKEVKKKAKTIPELAKELVNKASNRALTDYQKKYSISNSDKPDKAAITEFLITKKPGCVKAGKLI